jgi:argininosuccinate lyase
MQEDKEPLFDTVDTLKGVLSIIILCAEKMRVMEDRMHEALETGFLEATDLAEYLVKKGVPFREAHHIIGRIVLEAFNKGCSNLSSFNVDELKEFSKYFDADVVSYLKPGKAAARKDVPGGTSPVKVKEAIGRAEEYLKSL